MTHYSLTHLRNNKMTAKPAITDKTLFVLGAGVDVALGFPTMQNLISELARFSVEDGKKIESAIRQHVKGMRFNLSKRAGEQGEQFGEMLLSSHTHLLNKIDSALNKHTNQNNPKIKAVRTVVDQLRKIGEFNHLDDETCKSLCDISGEKETESGGDFLFNPRGLVLTNAPRQAIRKIFQGALTEISGLTEDEIKAFNEVISVISNFEEMLGGFFSGFFTKNIGDQKKYFYLSWLLWSYLRIKQIENFEKRENSFYKTLSDLNNHNVISFNYTRFFMTEDYSKISHFHGDCEGYIRFDNREYIDRDDRINQAKTTDDLVKFFSEMQINWEAEPPEILIPGIVPPLSVKPIICNEYLDRWSQAASRIEDADHIIIVGYSFNVADEHFNDLIRKRNTQARISLINPDASSVKQNIAHVIGLDHTNLTKSPVGGITRWKYGRLCLFDAKAEDITAEKLQEILS